MVPDETMPAGDAPPALDPSLLTTVTLPSDVPVGTEIPVVNMGDAPITVQAGDGTQTILAPQPPVDNDHVETGAEPFSDADIEANKPAAPLSRADKMKAKLRDVLAAQPFRGHAVHKDDLLACLDAMIDGPDED